MKKEKYEIYETKDYQNIREVIHMRMTLNRMTLEHITLEHIGFVHHGFGVELPVYLL